MTSSIFHDNWRGCSMEEIYHYLSPYDLKQIASVRPSENHTVLYEFPIKCAENEPPKPLRGDPKWNSCHVRLPCSFQSQYPIVSGNGNVIIGSRWELIEKALLRPISSSKEMEAAILSYNSKYRNVWNFHALHKLFNEELDDDESKLFFQNLLPCIIQLALRLPELVQTAIPLMKQGQNRSVTLSQQQIACLLANGFLCTFPKRNTFKRKSEYSRFSDINFSRLYQTYGNVVLEKLKCICHYFRRVCGNNPVGVVTFSRRSIPQSDLPNWSKNDSPLGTTPMHITSEGTIEDQGHGLLQVDFANKFIGGGVLGSGCVQEEIRFVICPELLVSKLFTECLHPNEALLMSGCERYSRYKGYSSSFLWNGNYDDNTPFDKSRRKQTHIVAIDALSFIKISHQYREQLMLRELNKAYVGFYHPLSSLAPGVASGNWGCGAFGGEATLKALLQLMACTVAKRPLVYYTFGNTKLRDSVHNLRLYFIKNNVRVKDLWASLCKFRYQNIAFKSLYSFLYKCLEHENQPNKSTRNGEQSLFAITPDSKKIKYVKSTDCESTVTLMELSYTSSNSASSAFDS